MYTPWGPSQSVEELADGIVTISTAGHGGIKLDAARNRRMPEYMRRSGGWYEEDCEWCLPFVVFEDELLAGGDEHTAKAIRGGFHTRTLKNCFPDAYERYFHTVIPEGESTIKDERLFYQRHAHDYLVVAAFGDWHEKVPTGSVGVCARVGGRPGQGPERWFMIPAEEYGASRYQFVVDPVRHPEIQSLSLKQEA